ncbi:MAG: PaaI family thioesterase [Deltaproteobacteria bacterium]|nr:PaaI family thioesterase [Deltaproteobacteria bacterium]
MRDLPVNLESTRIMVEEFIPFVRKVGVVLEEAGPRHVKLRYPAQDANLNHVGMQHAGALFTFGETCGGAAILTSFELNDVILVAKGARIDYRKPVYDDIWCTIDVEPETVERVERDLAANDKALYPLAMEVVNAAGELVFQMTVDFHFRKRG